MKIMSVPTYKDLFDDDTPKIEDLLEGIPSYIIVGLLSQMQSELLLQDSDKSQEVILEWFLRRQHPQVRQQFLEKLSILQSSYSIKLTLFCMHHVMDFMHHVLMAYDSVTQNTMNATPDQELRFLKAYFVIVEQQDSRHTMATGTLSKDDFFYRSMWPLLIKQSGTRRIHPITEMIRGLVMLHFLRSTPYVAIVDEFIEKRGYDSPLSFTFGLASVIQDSWDRLKANPNSEAKLFFRNQLELEPIFNEFTLDVSTYKSESELTYDNHRNYRGIRQNPLFKCASNAFLVLNWDFFVNKLYEGLVFDFYKNSGIAEVGDFNDFLKFKKYLSEEMTEKFLFRGLLQKIATKKHDVLMFDNGDYQGFPDGYFRRGNDLIIFEVKDAFFPENVISKASYHEIKSAIDTKYNNPKKGTGQLIKQLNRLLKSPYENPTRYKHSRNLRVYPVIIYTDRFFSMPGVNRYLQAEFDNQVKVARLDKQFKKVRPLTFLSIHFLINHIDILKEKKNSLPTLIDSYFKKQESDLNKSNRSSSDLEDSCKVYDSFEEAMSKIRHNRIGFIREVFDALELAKETAG